MEKDQPQNAKILPAGGLQTGGETLKKDASE